VVLTVGHLAQLLRTFFADGSQWGLNISYSFEDQPLGTAGPLALVDGLDSTFLVANGDVLTTLDLRQLVEYHKTQRNLATIAVHRRQVKIDFGVVQMDPAGCIGDYIEKPAFDYTVSMGVYVFEPAVMKFISFNRYLDFPDLVLKMIAAGEKVGGYVFDGYWMDLGRPDDYAQAVEDFANVREQFLMEE